MKHRTLILLLLFAAPVFAQQTPVPVIHFRSVPDFLKLPTNMYFGEVSRRGGEFERARFRFLARQHYRPGIWSGRGAIAGIRGRRKIYSRDRPQSLRVVFLRTR